MLTPRKIMESVKYDIFLTLNDSNISPCLDLIFLNTIHHFMTESQSNPTQRNLTLPDNLLQDAKIKKQLEGQCKIKHSRLIEFSCLKTVLLIIPIILSIICLFLLKYYKHLRVKVFYFYSDRKSATHIYIKGEDEREEEIVQLHSSQNTTFFFYKNLKYELLPNDEPIPVGINYQTELRQKLQSQNFRRTGLTNEQAAQRKKLYEANQHIVKPPQYYEYMYEVMTQPFFCLQYVAAVIYIVQKLAALGILLLAASFVTTSINYILLYISYRKIKQMAETVEEVDVLRDGALKLISSTELVPGDIFVPKNNIYCDAVLLRGQIYVNESNLTGQSVPIGKFALEPLAQFRQRDTTNWIFQGSKILESRNALAIVMHTGYSTRRGRIIRRILHRNPVTPHFFTTCMYFVLINYVIGIILYLATLPVRLYNDLMERILLFLNFLLILTFCIPPTLPIYFNVVYSFSLIRLKLRDIYGTQPQKTVQGANLKLMCFDKTGTLTQDEVLLNKIYKFHNDNYQDISQRIPHKNDIDEKLFGSCHTVRFIEQKLMGDEVDLKMFMHSKYTLAPVSQSGSCFDVKTTFDSLQQKIKVIKVHQYESRHQSMSVLTYDQSTNKYFIFAKGAPELIHNHSTIKYPFFQQLLQDISYRGFRTIGYGYKQIQSKEIGSWLNQSRSNFLTDIAMLGILVFQNKVKQDSAQVINKLQQANISSSIITGDNIYIAIQTATTCGLILPESQIILIQGNSQILHHQQRISSQMLQVKRITFHNRSPQIKNDQLTFKQYIQCPHPIVVDNSFVTLAQIFHDFQLAQQIKVYARISPENKALIIKTIKNRIKKQRDQLKFIEKALSLECDKVGMVGDGANDLLAIKEADIGIGISNCDSSYAANFTIQELLSLDYIIRQAKCSQRNAIQIIRYVTISSFIAVPLLFIMETQAVFFSPFQLLFLGLSKTIAFPTFIALSRPSQDQTKHIPSSNFLQLQNILTFWGNVIINTLGLLAVMIYYRTQDEYFWNTKKATIQTGWNHETSLVTAQFLFLNIYPIAIVFGIYQSQPWKEPIYRNYLLLIFIILNIILSTAISFLVPQLKDLFKFVDMSYRSMLIIFIIGLVASFFTVVYNQLLISAQFYDSKLEKNWVGEIVPIGLQNH